jgi:hypothetical protein
MKTLYSKEELHQQLKELKEKRETIYDKRVSLIKSFKTKQKSPENVVKETEIQNIDCKIESIQDKIKRLF